MRLDQYNRYLTVLALLALAIYTARIAASAGRAMSNGFAAYYTAASIVARSPRDMARVYDNVWFGSQIDRAGIHGVRDIFNIQPPTMALIMLPLAGLAPGVARLLWTLASLALLWGGLTLLMQALGLSARWGLWTLAACLLYAPVTENLQSGQVYILLFCLVCLLFVAFSRSPYGAAEPTRANAIAGTALGLMLVLKTTMVWLWPLLLVGSRRRALLWAIAVAAGIMLISVPVIGIEPWRLYVEQLPRLASEPQRYVTAYQTTTSLFGHLLVYNAPWSPAPLMNAPELAQVLTLATLLLALALSGVWGRIDDARLEVRMLSLALFTALATVNAPVSEGYHSMLVLPSLIVAVWWACRERPERSAWATLALAALLLGAPLPYLSHRLEAGWPALFAYPRVYGAYLLWGWLAWALRASFSGSLSNSGVLTLLAKKDNGLVGARRARQAAPLPASSAPVLGAASSAPTPVRVRLHHLSKSPFSFAPSAFSSVGRTNGFDFLRFVLATLVVLSHSMLIEGDANREPLSRLTHGNMTMGAVAVDGFFVISGFLVSQSWQRSRTVRSYLRKRALRILPGFVVASLLSTFVVGALGATTLAGYYSWRLVWKSLCCLLTLSPPYTPPTALVGLSFHSVDGPLWTIQYETLCYLLVVLLGVGGLYRRPAALFGLFGLVWTIEMLQLRHVIALSAPEPHLSRLLQSWPYCATFFLSGACLYVVRDRITYSSRGALLAVLLVIASVLTQRFVFEILPTAGAYLLLFAAFRAPKRLHAFARRSDLSYGIYLYGWPVQALLVWHTHATIAPWTLFFVTFAISLLLAALSWRFIERPFLRLKGRDGA